MDGSKEKEMTDIVLRFLVCAFMLFCAYLHFDACRCELAEIGPHHKLAFEKAFYLVCACCAFFQFSKPPKMPS